MAIFAPKILHPMSPCIAVASFRDKKLQHLSSCYKLGQEHIGVVQQAWTRRHHTLPDVEPKQQSLA